MDLGGFTVYRIRPEGVAADDRRAYLETHGGAWIPGGGAICRSRAIATAGAEAELHVWEAASHGGFLGRAPEDADRAAEVRRFMTRHWPAARSA